jgi:hypothetical protein
LRPRVGVRARDGTRLGAPRRALRARQRAGEADARRDTPPPTGPASPSDTASARPTCIGTWRRG